MLGAILDAVACALGRVDTVKLPELPRMADFAVWVTAAEPALEWEPGSFLQTYVRNRAAANEEVLDHSPIARLIRELAPWGGDHGGETADLLAALNARADDVTKKEKWWPKTPAALSADLTRLAPNFREAGIEIRRWRDGRRRHVRNFFRGHPTRHVKERHQRHQPKKVAKMLEKIVALMVTLVTGGPSPRKGPKYQRFRPLVTVVTLFHMPCIVA